MAITSTSIHDVQSITIDSTHYPESDISREFNCTVITVTMCDGATVDFKLFHREGLSIRMCDLPSEKQP